MMANFLKVAYIDLVEDLSIAEVFEPEKVAKIVERLRGYDLFVQKVFGEFRVKCLYCSLWLFSPVVAKLHILGHITGENPLRNLAKPLDGDVVECKICGGRFVGFEAFEQHFGLHHDLDPEDLKKELKEVVKFKVSDDVPRSHGFPLDGKVVKLEPGSVIEVPRDIARVLAYYEYGVIVHD